MMLGAGSALTVAGVAVGAVGVAVAVGVVGVVAARRALVLITVAGGSMSPTYTDGEKLLVRRGGLRRPRVGDVVVFRHPQLARAAAATASAPAPARPDVDWMVKRVVAVHGDRIPDEIRPAVEAIGAIGPAEAVTAVPPGYLLVRGDNPRSLDSRHFGYVPATDVLGVSVRRRPQSSRRVRSL
jgi:signal peptidase I